MYRKYVYLSGVLLLAIVMNTNGGEPHPQQGRIVELLGIEHLVPDAILVATDECTMLADGKQCRVPQPSEKMHSVHPLLLELSQEAAEWIFNDIAPCGEGPNGRTICASSDPSPAGKYVVIIVTYEADIPLRHTSHSVTHGLCFDADGIASNNYVPFPEYPYDFFAGTDLWYELVYDPDSGWQLWVTDVRQDFADVASDVRVLIVGSEMAWFVPLQELESETGPQTAARSLEHGIRPLSLVDDLTARFRVTVHRWLQNYGLDGSFWSACLWMIVGQDLAGIPAEPITVTPGGFELKPWDPSPHDGATDVTAPPLSWTPGTDGWQWRVSLGTDEGAVAAGDTSVELGTTTGTTFNPKALNAGTNYFWKIDETNSDGTVEPGDVWRFTTADPVEGNILREWWDNIVGPLLDDLTRDPRYPNNPDGKELLDKFDAPVNFGDNYGQRLHGWLKPPETGNYTLWVAGDDYVALYLSTDEDPANKVVIATVPGPGGMSIHLPCRRLRPGIRTHLMEPQWHLNLMSPCLAGCLVSMLLSTMSSLAPMKMPCGRPMHPIPPGYIEADRLIPPIPRLKVLF